MVLPTQIEGDNLVRLAVHDERHDFAFTRRERCKAPLQFDVAQQRLPVFGVLLGLSVRVPLAVCRAPPRPRALTAVIVAGTI